MDETFQNLKFPTERHQRYLYRVFEYCAAKRIGLGVLGSLATGAASRFSDIDLALSANVAAGDLRRIAEDFEEPVMGFFTVNPKGVLTVAYAHGFCVEIGVRKAIASGEPTGFRPLLADGFTTGPEPELVDLSSLYRPDFVIARDGFRILYKAALKYLGGKTETAVDLLGELVSGAVSTRAEFPGGWKALYDGITKKESIPRPLAEEFEWLSSRIGLI